MNNEKSLKPVQLSAIQMLAVGTPIVQVAHILEVSAMTIYRWQRIPAFEARLNAVTSSGLQQIAKMLNATALTAVETLQEVLCDMSQPTSIRMEAAISVLNVMPALNSALEEGLKHRAGDFDLKQRFNTQGYTYDSRGEPCNASGKFITAE